MILASDVKKELARRKLINFCSYTKEDWHTNWHHSYICSKLDDFLIGKIKNLIITCPPRVGKSEIATRRFPSFAFGINPDLQIISASYSHDLSSRMNRDVQRIIQCNKYRELFPGTKLNEKNLKTTSEGSFLKNSDIFEIVDKNGCYRSAGIGGGITGMGADIAIIDDPVKDMAEARSERIRNNIWDWFSSALTTRLEKSGQVLIIMTRWHEDDLVGKILSKENSFEVIRIEALKQTEQDFDPRDFGQALWPNKFDEDRYKNIKKDVGSKVFESLYQQNPTPQGGTIIKEKDIKIVDELPKGTRTYFQSWDLTFKESQKSDYVVGTVWCKIDANYYLVHMTRAKMSFTKTVSEFKKVSLDFPEANFKFVEKAANAEALYDTLKDEISGIVLVPSTTGKIERLDSVSMLFESSNVYFLSSIDELDQIKAELTGFPFLKHDDIVDSISLALISMKKRKASFGAVKKKVKSMRENVNFR